ncbi:MAG: PilZ domain-containing protein [Proteobacteria bacterium]|nr:PilZ domain-containing protein [Pseudomonadota bacterium]MBU1688780.1 PilZ domain-containing protein [Pseudomonadota bacterium]
MSEVERRKNTRVPFQATLDLKFADGRTHKCETNNLSLYGVFAEGVSGHPRGEVCDVVLNLTGATSDVRLRMKGEIMRVESNGVGLKFVEIDLDSFYHLKNILYYNSGDPDRLEEEFFSQFDQ